LLKEIFHFEEFTQLIHFSGLILNLSIFT